MFELDGRIYELRYDIKSIEMIEASTGQSIVNLMNGVPTLNNLKTMIGCALFNDDNNKVSVKQGVEIAEKLITTVGMLKCFTASIEKIAEDCGFLFLDA